MERLVSSVSRPSAASARYLPQLMLATRGTHKVHRESFLNASSSNYIDEIYEQWTKDPKSVHKVNSRQSSCLHLLQLIYRAIIVSSHGTFIFVVKFINGHLHWA
jgi:hypothetical protein